jgi:hypothetical protein
MLLDLDSRKWAELDGGYRTLYDASIALRSLRDGVDVWDELWNELHHQGDLGIASYAAVPQLVHIVGELTNRDWNFYGLVATIEVARRHKGNPPVPDWLAQPYDSAWLEIRKLAIQDLLKSEDSYTTQTILSVLALAKGEWKLGAMLVGLDKSEVEEWYEEQR